MMAWVYVRRVFSIYVGMNTASRQRACFIGANVHLVWSTLHRSLVLRFLHHLSLPHFQELVLVIVPGSTNFACACFIVFIFGGGWERVDFGELSVGPTVLCSSLCRSLSSTPAWLIIKTPLYLFFFFFLFLFLLLLLLLVVVFFPASLIW
jgi:hypothetical protein